MDRRESIKSLLVGSLAGGAVVTGCATSEQAEEQQKVIQNAQAYGRTQKEKARDERLMSEVFFSDHEMDTIATLCDLILPSEGDLMSAGDAGVPDFIHFIARDMPSHQLPIRGGVMWLDNFANESHNKTFKSLSQDQQKGLLDQIAYPEDADPSLSQGVKFFDRMRNLTLTGFYTSEMGVKELGYAGNSPNVWDGVPEEVQKKHGVAYEEEWLAKCVDQSKRMDTAQWDDDMNLIS